MGIFIRCVVVVAFGVAAAGCLDADISDGAASREPGGTTRVLKPSAASPGPVMMTKPAWRQSNITSPIPFVLPAAPAAYTPVVTIGPESPPDGPKLPLGPDIAPHVDAAPAVKCKANADLLLDCPAEAPTPSTCTSYDNLPSGCQSRLARGATYPLEAYPACCR